MRKNNNDELEKFKKDIDLVRFAANAGFSVRLKRGADYNQAPSGKTVTMTRGVSGGKSIDKIVIGTNSQGKGTYYAVKGNLGNGSIIDFARNEYGENLGHIRKRLRQFGGALPAHVPVAHAKSYAKPRVSAYDLAGVRAAVETMRPIERPGDNRYLENVRKIDFNILNQSRFRPTIMTDTEKYDNAVFLHTDKGREITGFEVKNNNFTGFAENGEKTLWQSANINHALEVVICESAIDALSHAQLRRTSEVETAYISFGGSMSPSQLVLIKELVGDRKALIAVDNDEAGEKFTEQLTELLEETAEEINIDLPAENSDFNNDLIEKIKEQIEVSQGERSEDDVAPKHHSHSHSPRMR